MRSHALAWIGLLALVSGCASSPAAHRDGLTAGPAQSRELTATIERLDRELFAAVFGRCDPVRVRELVTDDFEYFHDKWGQTADSGDAFAEAIMGLCARQVSGEDFRSRRELVAGSLEVFPMNQYGAVETGVHRFYRLTPGKPDELTEVARFAHLWREQDGRWRLARVLSYAHELDADR